MIKIEVLRDELIIRESQTRQRGSCGRRQGVRLAILATSHCPSACDQCEETRGLYPRRAVGSNEGEVPIDVKEQGILNAPVLAT